MKLSPITFLPLTIVFLHLHSCTDNTSESQHSCTSNISCCSADSSLDSSVLCDKSVFNFRDRVFCSNDFSIKFWDINRSTLVHQPEFVLEGALIENQDSVFLKNKFSSDLQYLFSLNGGDSNMITRNIDLRFVRINSSNKADCVIEMRTTRFCAESIISDAANGVKTYKLRFFEYPFFSSYAEDNDLILFYIPQKGFSGMYLCWNRNSAIPTSQDSIFTYKGNLYTEFYSYYFDPPGSCE